MRKLVEKSTEKLTDKLSNRNRFALCGAIFVCILSLALGVYGYVDYQRECQRLAGREAVWMAAHFARQLDESLTSEDWESISLPETLQDCVELVVLDNGGNVIYTTDENLAEECRRLQENGILEGNAQKMKSGGVNSERNDSYMTALSSSQVADLKYYACYKMEKNFASGGWFRSIVFCWPILPAVFFVALILHRRRSPAEERVSLMPEPGDWNSLSEKLEKLIGDHGRYYAALMMPKECGEPAAQGNVDMEAFCHEISEKMIKYLKNVVWLPLVCRNGTIFCIFKEEESFSGEAGEFYGYMQETAMELYGCRILMGVSLVHDKCQEIEKAYRESLVALIKKDSWESVEEQTADERNECYFYKVSTEVKRDDYDRSYEKAIYANIKAMDREQCRLVIKEFGEYLQGVGSYNEVMIYSLRMVNIILLTAIDIRLDLESLFPDGIDRIYQQVVEMPEPDRVNRLLWSCLLEPVLQARDEHMKKHSYSMLEEIEQKIRETRGNITLTECAEALGVHHTYIWKVLKAEKGKSFSDCLEEYKLKEAKRLLRQTDLSVAEIAAELNYTNAQNFIRFFSKSTGMTPGKYRKLS